MSSMWRSSTSKKTKKSVIIISVKIIKAKTKVVHIFHGISLKIGEVFNPKENEEEIVKETKKVTKKTSKTTKKTTTKKKITTKSKKK